MGPFPRPIYSVRSDISTSMHPLTRTRFLLVLMTFNRMKTRPPRRCLNTIYKSEHQKYTIQSWEVLRGGNVGSLQHARLNACMHSTVHTGVKKKTKRRRTWKAEGGSSSKVVLNASTGRFCVREPRCTPQVETHRWLLVRT